MAQTIKAGEPFHWMGHDYAVGDTVNTTGWSQKAVRQLMIHAPVYVDSGGGVVTETDPVAVAAVTAHTSAINPHPGKFLSARARPAMVYVEDYGAVADDATDCSGAIKQAIDDVVTAGGGGTVKFGKGVYRVNANPDRTRGGNAIIPLPRNTTAPVGIPLKLEGVCPMDRWVPSAAGYGSVIKTTRTTDAYAAQYGCPSVIGAATVENGGGNRFDMLSVELENLGISLPVNPSIAGVDLGGVVSAEIDGLGVAAGDAAAANPVQPVANLAAFGLYMPDRANYGKSLIRSAGLYGLNFGLVANEEHLNVIDITTKWCNGGIALTNASGSGTAGNGGWHAAHISKWQSEWCAYHLCGYGTAGVAPITVAVGGGASSRFVFLAVDMWNIEDAVAAKWYTTTKHIYDPNNVLRMSGRVLRASQAAGGVVSPAALLLTGGIHAILTDLTQL